MKSVGADDHVGINAVTCATGDSSDSTYAPAIVEDDVVDADTVPDVCSAVGRGIDQGPVEQRPAWRVQRADTKSRLDWHGDVLLAVAERGRVHRRGAGCNEGGQEPPAMQLQNGAAHQRMRRQRVRAVCAFVDQHHSRTRSCEQLLSDLVRDLPCVTTDTVDKTGVPAALKIQAEHV